MTPAWGEASAIIFSQISVKIQSNICREDVPAETYAEKYPGVPSCCDVVGYMSDGKCPGTSASGVEFDVRNFPVCHDKEHTGKKEVKRWKVYMYLTSIL